MKYFLATLLISITLSGAGQSFMFDTTHNKASLEHNFYYGSTDFSKIDSLSLWRYELDTTYRGNASDSPKPVGRLSFWRTRSIDDGISKKLYGRDWQPGFEFFIYSLNDSAYCFNASYKTRFFSSCVPPNTGGDIIIAGPYIFLNHSVCLSCERYDTKVDYCRPLINCLFSHVDTRKINSVGDITSQFSILKGQKPD